MTSYSSSFCILFTLCLISVKRIHSFYPRTILFQTKQCCSEKQPILVPLVTRTTLFRDLVLNKALSRQEMRPMEETSRMDDSNAGQAGPWPLSMAAGNKLSTLAQDAWMEAANREPKAGSVDAWVEAANKESNAGQVEWMEAPKTSKMRQDGWVLSTKVTNASPLEERNMAQVCAKLKCAAQLELSPPICACNFNTGNVVSFKNKCDMKKHNCRFDTAFKMILQEICPWEFESRRAGPDEETFDYSNPKYYN